MVADAAVRGNAGELIAAIPAPKVHGSFAGGWTREKRRRVKVALAIATAGVCACMPETMVERHFVKTAKVHMNQGASYGLGGANHMRMNIATSRKTLELALNNLATALKRTTSSAA